MDFMKFMDCMDFMGFMDFMQFIHYCYYLFKSNQVTKTLKYLWHSFKLHNEYNLSLRK